MTSLVLFDSGPPQTNENAKPGYDWGTGKTRNRSNSDPSTSHESGTFLYK